jgi:hypothetical protein
MQYKTQARRCQHIRGLCAANGCSLAESFPPDTRSNTSVADAVSWPSFSSVSSHVRPFASLTCPLAFCACACVLHLAKLSLTAIPTPTPTSTYLLIVLHACCLSIARLAQQHIRVVGCRHAARTKLTMADAGIRLPKASVQPTAHDIHGESP